MKRILLTVVATAVLPLCAGAQTVEGTLNSYDRNEPFGWAVCDRTSTPSSYVPYSLTGGGTGSKIVLKSNGTDQLSEIQSALCNYSVIVLDGSEGDFLIGAGGINLNSTRSRNKTIVGINGATLRQMNEVDRFRSYLDGRFASETRKDKAGYVQSRNISIPQTSSWYVREGDELYVKGYMIDYCYEVLGIRDTETLLSEPYRNWGVLRINSSEERGTGCNIIIRNITFAGPGSLDLSGLDALCLNGCHNIWVDHCHFQDGLDGNLDIIKTSERNSTCITVSWCTFGYTEKSYNHRFSCLMSTKDNGADMFVTFANCIWEGGIYTRTPMGGGRIHQINCLFDAPGSALRIQNTGCNPELPYWIDHCYFAAGRGKNESVSRGYVCYQNGSSGTYYYQCTGNYAANGEEAASNASTQVPYEYRDWLIPAAKVPSVLTSFNGAGPTLTDPLKIGR